ncbi:MAG: prepilin peptidase [Candidatus Liptonbacteria bacterium]|nr:prepilin peptidase [Candidatus Liptonbacteria bacterium]
MLLFLFGLAVGSFLDVIATRYNPNKFLLEKKVIGGRSRCAKCGKELGWFELVPVISFALQAGRCRSCKAKLSLEYPLVEILCGLIFVFVPFQVLTPSNIQHLTSYLAAFLWILVFLTLLLITLIDLRLNLIPDEANIFLVILGVLLIILTASHFSLAEGSFLGPYAAITGLRQNIWLNHLIAAISSGLFFGLLIVITRGRGMGGGDLKLGAALGVVFGWPDILAILASAFIIGSLFSLVWILRRKKTLKSAMPFGPFLAIASVLIFFFGGDLARLYLKFLNFIPQ